MDVASGCQGLSGLWYFGDIQRYTKGLYVSSRRDSDPLIVFWSIQRYATGLCISALTPNQKAHPSAGGPNSKGYV